MNNGETYGGAGGQALSEIEARIVAWISGEASASERVELEGLAGPIVSAFSGPRAATVSPRGNRAAPGPGRRRRTWSS